MNNAHPNLFDYATHELSQDAVLIWLLRYADERYREDMALHDVAQKFVQLLIDASNAPIHTVECWKQWESIDITANINGEFALVLEDKAGANLHGDQLKRYRESATKWANEDNLKLRFVYLNTENPNTDDRKNVMADGYKIITRLDVLNILKMYEGTNEILLDYRNKLDVAESETQSYQSLPVKDWSGRAWQGFYDWIHSLRPDSTWEWVNNRGGGFWGTWWGNRDNWIKDEVALYCQIEQGRFIFKMYGETDKNRGWGYRLRDTIEMVANDMEVHEIQRPGRMSFSGCATSLLIVECDDYLGTGVIDLCEVKGRIEKYESIISKTIEIVEQ